MTWSTLKSWHKFTIAGVLGALLPIAGQLANAPGQVGHVATALVSAAGIATTLGLLSAPAPKSV